MTQDDATGPQHARTTPTGTDQSIGDRTDEPQGEPMDEGTTGELLNDKMVGYDVLRGQAEAGRTNPNDQPGFDDGIEGGFDFEDRQGDPNSVTGSDLEGEVEAGAGGTRSGGVDGGPERTTPLPGQQD